MFTTYTIHTALELNLGLNAKKCLNYDTTNILSMPDSFNTLP